MMTVRNNVALLLHLIFNSVHQLIIFGLVGGRQVAWVGNFQPKHFNDDHFKCIHNALLSIQYCIKIIFIMLLNILAWFACLVEQPA